MMSKEECKKADLESVCDDIDGCLNLLYQYREDDKRIEHCYWVLIRAFNLLSPVLERMKKHDK